MIDLNAVMKALASRRPVFHSEADFQHALAIQIAEVARDAHIRLEYRPVSHERIYLDVWVADGDRKLAIELKLKTRSASIDWHGETFDLANHGAQPIGAYDVLKDVQRLERVRADRDDIEAYVAFLTNDATYWNQPTGSNTVGAAFGLQEGRTATGLLQWSAHTGQGTMKNREHPIKLAGSYDIAWHDYSKLGTAQGMSFRYMIIPVTGKATAVAIAANATPAETRAVRQAVPAQKTARRSKYAPLYDYLVSSGPARVQLNYAQINEILGSDLPQSAYDHPAAFWANSYTHDFAKYWLDAGWKVDGHGVSPKRVVFVRVGSTKK